MVMKKSRILRIWCMEGRRGHLEFHTFRRFFYRLHLIMQGMKTWPNMSQYRRRCLKLHSINCGCHVYKTNIRTFIHSFDTLPWWCVFLKHKIQCWPIFFGTDWIMAIIIIIDEIQWVPYSILHQQLNCSLKVIICNAWNHHLTNFSVAMMISLKHPETLWTVIVWLILNYQMRQNIYKPTSICTSMQSSDYTIFHRTVANKHGPSNLC